jgi:hypothetical protein
MLMMRAVQQNVFLILNSVPVTFVTYPELKMPSSIPVMMRSCFGPETYGQKGERRTKESNRDLGKPWDMG